MKFYTYFRIVVVILFVALQMQAWSQTVNTVGRGNQLELVSSAEQVAEGGTETNGVFVALSNGNLQTIPAHWKMSIQVTGPIHGDNNDNGATSNGNILSPSYFQLTFNPSSANPNNSDMDALVSNKSFLLSNNETFFITDADYPMVHYGTYIYIPFNFTVLPHTPFSNCNFSHYWFPLQVKLYYTDASGQPHVESAQNIGSNSDLLMVNFPGSNVTNSIQLNAANADLYFNTTSDYTNGVQASYTDVLKVVCADDYQKVDVKAGSDYLSASDNSTLPTNIVHVSASNGSNNTGTNYGFNDIQLSSTSQPLINNINQTDANGVTFNLKYYINGSQSSQISHTSDLYSTVLYFSLDPQ